MILDFVKEQLHLSSPLALLLVLAIGIVWLWRRPVSRGPRAYLTAAAFGFWFAATPIGAFALNYPLSRGATRVMNIGDARGADAVVVLGGGILTAEVGGLVAGTLNPDSLVRALEAARVARKIGARLVIASGGIPRPDLQLKPESELLRDVLVKAGVAPDVIVEDSASKTTREQATLVGPLLRAHNVQHFVLVTSAAHMRRSLAVFHAAGFDPVPSASPAPSLQIALRAWLMPDSRSLWHSDNAIYEYAATIYYWLRGWTV